MLPGDAALSRLYGYPGPYVTVYLDATTPAGASVADVLDERWSVVRDSLTDVDEDTLDAIEESLTPLAGGEAVRGITVIAARGEVCLAAALPGRPPTDRSSVGALPDVIPYLRLRAPEIPNLVVRAEDGRARIHQLNAGRLVALGDWIPLAGADPAAAVVRSAARQAVVSDPRTVVAVGDAPSLAPVVERLEKALVTEVVIRVLAPGWGDTEVVDAVVAALVERRRRDDVELVQTVRDSIGRRGTIAVGPRDVAAALRNAQADVVVLNGSVLDDTCWVGPRPTEFGVRDQEARSVGLREVMHASFGAAVIRAALATRAAVVLIEESVFAAPQGVIARLRRS